MDMSVFHSAKLLVVGAGGIGCELLKNLVLCDFLDITVIDLDTIDVSNLNRQFLFRKEHVGKSKAEVARDSVLCFNPRANIRAIHGSIMHEDYGVDFFRQFSIVLNALDNNAARRHVNRLCIATGVALIESGSRGYLGQVYPILKGLGPCYECTPQAPQKTYPACTIRNTPTEPIHCVVWAKYLFNQLYGEEDPDADVAPYLMSEEGEEQLQSTVQTNGSVESVSTSHDYHIPLRIWYRDRAVSKQNGCQSPFNVERALLKRLFHDDIVYLLSMKGLWKEKSPRHKPTPLNELTEAEKNGDLSDDAFDNSTGQLKDQRKLTTQQWSDIFCKAVHCLAQRISSEDSDDSKENLLIWDKDDDMMMDFVAAAANLRLSVFHMDCLTRFQVKSMAGNIVPAIATTNGVVAGLIVLEAIKVLQKRKQDCLDNFLHCAKSGRGKFILGCSMNTPNPHCSVCSDERPQLVLHCMSGVLHTPQMTVQVLKQEILQRELGMMVPEVITESGTMIISADEEETEGLLNRPLGDLKVKHGMTLVCTDDVQQYALQLMVEEVHDPTTLTLSDHELVTLEEKRFFVRPLITKAAENATEESTGGTTIISGVKRSAENEGVNIGEPLAKKLHTDDESVESNGKKDDDLPLVVEDDDIVMGEVFLPM